MIYFTQFTRYQVKLVTRWSLVMAVTGVKVFPAISHILGDYRVMGNILTEFLLQGKIGYGYR